MAPLAGGGLEVARCRFSSAIMVRQTWSARRRFASPGLPRGLTLGDLSSVVEVSAASGRPDLGDRDGVQRGVELPITRPGQPVAGLVGAGYLDRCGACVVAYADAVGNRLGRPVRPTNLAAVMSPMPTV